MDKYCLDTNAFVEPWNKYFSISRCPEYWNILDRLARENIVFCPDQVKLEVYKADDELKAWLEGRPHFIRQESEDVQEKAREILRVFPNLISVGANRSMADPWVVAHAMVEDAIVVSKEYIATINQRITRVKIPDVCRHFNVACINDFEFIDKLGIRFEASLP